MNNLRASIVRNTASGFIPCRFFLGIQNNIPASGTSGLQVYDSPTAPDLDALSGIGLMEDVATDYTLVETNGTITQNTPEGRTLDCMSLERTATDEGGVSASSIGALPELIPGRTYTMGGWHKGDGVYGNALGIVLRNLSRGVFLQFSGHWAPSSTFCITSGSTTSYQYRERKFTIPPDWSVDDNYLFVISNRMDVTGFLYVDDWIISEDPICELQPNDQGGYIMLAHAYETGQHQGVWVAFSDAGEVQVHVSD
jgi:hypothetical protein